LNILEIIRKSIGVIIVLRKFSAMGNPLEKLDTAIIWNHFKPLLNSV
jgi:hypothetical protein